jgi:HSP20 family protein
MGDAIAVHDTSNTTQTKQVVRRTATPHVDVYENEDNVFVVADVPGVAREAIDVRVEHDTLTLETTRAPEAGEGPALAREYAPVDFVRSFRIPAGIDAASVSAEVKHGTLVVRLPKAAAAKSRKVPVVAS